MLDLMTDQQANDPRPSIVVQQERPLLLRAEEAARLIGVSRSKVFLMMAADQLPGIVRIGRSVRISREALERWVQEQSGADVSRPGKAA